jgi:predicted metalloprotease with PDZ domain
MMTRRIVDEQIAIFGEPADYDAGTYTFISDYLPWVNGDAMEHRNSTFISDRASIADSAKRVDVLESMSHEFFHSWNMERIRSRGIEPFDFERANMSRDLWFGEGFTQYYGDLIRKRAGFLSDDTYAEIMAGDLIGIINSPARMHNSAVEVSMLAPFYDGASFLDPTNRRNIFASYYSWGMVIALSLDLTLRTRFALTLDDYMRALWKDFGKHQTPAWAPARAYTTADLEAQLAKFTKDSSFAREFFRRYVEGREVADLTSMLAKAGFQLSADSVVPPYFGASLDNDSTAVFVNWTVANGSAYAAGLSSADLIYAVDGKPVNSRDSLNAIIRRHKVGDVVKLDVEQRKQRRTIDMKLIGLPSLTLKTFEKAGLPLTPEIRGFRTWWLGSRVQSRPN